MLMSYHINFLLFSPNLIFHDDRMVDSLVPIYLLLFYFVNILLLLLMRRKEGRKREEERGIPFRNLSSELYFLKINLLNIRPEIIIITKIIK